MFARFSKWKNFDLAVCNIAVSWEMTRKFKTHIESNNYRHGQPILDSHCTMRVQNICYYVFKNKHLLIIWKDFGFPNDPYNLQIQDSNG